MLNFLIGGLDDQLANYVWGGISGPLFKITEECLQDYPLYSNMFWGFQHPLLTSQPLYNLVNSVLLTIFGSGVFNVFVLLTLLANFIVTYLALRKFKAGLALALLFSFSSYAWIHMGKHLDLSQLWVFPAMYILLQKSNKHGSIPYLHSVKTGLFIFLVGVISNYYGFFLFVYYSLYTFLNVSFGLKSKADLLKEIKSFSISILVSIIMLLITLFPYFKATYIDYDTERQNGFFALGVQRPLEDFITFSARPWYSVLPPLENPLFGSITKNALEIGYKTNYFLADDYFAKEHSGNYFGLLFSFVTLITVIYLLAKKPTILGKEAKIYLILYILFFILMLPPYFTVSGIRFWTPGYLIFKLFPMFRVTARLSILQLFSLVVMAGYVFDYFFTVMKPRNAVILTLVLALFTLSEVFVPVTVYKETAGSEVYDYLSKNVPICAKVAVYPGAQSEVALLTLPKHNKLLLNPVDYRVSDYDYSEFTSQLPTTSGFGKFSELGGEYLVVFKEDLSAEARVFFSNNISLQNVAEFPSAYVYRRIE